MVYRFIDKNKIEFGLRWICKKLKISLTSYYNYLKHRKGIILSKATVFKYMNKELGLHAVLKLKKSRYKKVKPDLTYENKLNQNFTVFSKNSIWCTDFTYMRLKSGKTRYNCSIIDLYDRSVVASANSKYINAQFAMETLAMALKKEKTHKPLMLHTDRGSQFTSYEFSEFCKLNNIVQRMSLPGCPYDNAVIERFYKTFKSEFVYKHVFYNDEDLDEKTNQYIHLWHNYLTPHSYNNGLSPLKKNLPKPSKLLLFCLSTTMIYFLVI